MKSSVPFSVHDLTIYVDRAVNLTKTWVEGPDGAPKKSDPARPYLGKGSLINAPDIYAMSKALTELQTMHGACVLRGQPTEASYEKFARRTLLDRIEDDGELLPPTYVDVPRDWAMFDIDGFVLPVGLSVIDDAELAALHVRREIARYIPGFDRVTAHIHLSSSAGFGGGNLFKAHIWVKLSKKHDSDELRRFANAVNAAWQADGNAGKLVDPAVFNAIQIHFTADPLFDGVDDPLLTRSFLIEGDDLRLAVDIPDEISAPLPSGRTKAFSGTVDHILSCISDEVGYLHEPLLDAVYKAVSELDGEVSLEAEADLIERCRTAVLSNTTPGRDDRDRHADPAYLRQDIRAAAQKYRARKAAHLQEAERRAEEARAQVVDRDPVKVAEDDFRNRIGKVFNQIELAVTATAKRKQIASAAHEVIIQEMFADPAYRDDQEVVDALGGIPIGFKTGSAGWRELKKRKSAATRRASKQIAGEMGLDKMPKLPPLVVVSTTTGLGKSTTALSYIDKIADVRFDWLAPRHNLLKQSMEDLEEMGNKAVIQARGRRAEDPEEGALEAPRINQWIETATFMCPRFGLAEELASVGKNMNATICPACPLKDACGYRKQRQKLKAVTDANGVVFGPSQYVQHRAPWLRGDAVIIDEDFINNMKIEKSIPIEELRKEETAFRLVNPEVVEQTSFVLNAVATAIEGHAALPFEYLESLGITLDELRVVYKAIVEGQSGDDYISGSQSDAEVLTRVAMIKNTSRWPLVLLLRVMLRAWQAGLPRVDHINVVSDPKTMVKSVLVTDHGKVDIAKGKTIIVLDATGDVGLIEAVTGRKAQVIDVKAKENLHIVMANTTGSKSALYGGVRSSEGDITGNAPGIMEAIERFSQGSPCAVFTHHETEKAWIDLFPANCEVNHFGNLTGSNQYKEFGHAVILGRQQPSRRAFIPLASAIAATQGRCLITHEDYFTRIERDHPHITRRSLQRRDGYVNKVSDDGSVTKKAFDPDPIVEALRWRSCEGEIIQAVGRLRACRSDATKRVLMITDAVIDIYPPDEILAYRELKKGRVHRTVFDEYFARFGVGGVVPMGALDMVKRAPDLFSSLGAAREAKRRSSAKNKRHAPEYSIRGAVTFKTGTYRRADQRGQPSEFLLTEPLNLDEARQRLMELVGPLSYIEV